MDDESDDDDTREVKWSWRRDESGIGSQDVADKVSEEDSGGEVMRNGIQIFCCYYYY